MNPPNEKAIREAHDRAIAQKVSQEIMIRDLADIDFLRRTDQFDRYFLRRLRERRDALQKSYEDDEMDPVKREVTRQLLKQVKEFLALPEKDEATIRSQLR